jgi:hypothetical protein
MPRGKIDERAGRVVESDLELTLDEPQIEPRAAEHQPRNQYTGIRREGRHLRRARQVLAERAYRELDRPSGHQLHQVCTFVMAQQAGFDQTQLHRRHLHPLGEVDAVETVPEAAEL